MTKFRAFVLAALVGLALSLSGQSVSAASPVAIGLMATEASAQVAAGNHAFPHVFTRLRDGDGRLFSGHVRGHVRGRIHGRIHSIRDRIHGARDRVHGRFGRCHR